MITSVHNPLVKHITALQERKLRDAANEFVVEGWRFAGEALARGAKIKQVIYCPEQVRAEGEVLLGAVRRRGIPLEVADQRVLRKMSATEEPQGVLMLVGKPHFSWADLQIKRDSLLLIVDGVQDPGNLGTIIRTALAADVHQICLTRGTVDIYNAKVLRSTMGMLFSLVFLQELEPDDILAFCRERALPLVVGDAVGRPLYGARITWPFALVVGNEGAGPAPIFTDNASLRMAIPMAQGVESLNVAIATGIMLFEAVRQRDYAF